jgi:pyridoxal phosphate enzyme (YggS family)
MLEIQRIVDRYYEVLSDLPNNVILNLVTKFQPQSLIGAFIEKTGHIYFAENYTQEALEKWPKIKNSFSNLKLSMIGHLQTNKVNDAVKIFDRVLSIDSIKLALKFQNIKNIEFFANINIGSELQKSGFLSHEFHNFIINSPIDISGIMCVPPSGLNPEPYFQTMVDLKSEYEKTHCNVLKLSMGMSSDYNLAVKMGANEVRIGTLIFGERLKP